MIMHLVAYARLNESNEYAYDYSVDESDSELIKKKSQELSNITSDDDKSLYTVHFLNTEDIGLESVKHKDSYFEKAQEVKGLEEFVTIIRSNSKLTSIDVASYIKQIRPDIGSFALQKTLYYVYADFLEKYGRTLFSAKFLAFEKGPVDWNVYVAKKYHKEKLEKDSLFHSKIVCQKEKDDIVKVINDDILRYVEYYENVWKLYKSDDDEFNLTHKKGTPWSRAYEKGQNSPILDDDIINYHEIECI